MSEFTDSVNYVTLFNLAKAMAHAK